MAADGPGFDGEGVARQGLTLVENGLCAGCHGTRDGGADPRSELAERLTGKQATGTV